MAPETTEPAVNVNGRVLPLNGITPHLTALDWLREQGLTGCKEGCAEGECGACSIMVARPGLRTATEWTALNACLVPIAAFDGQELVTAEGLGTATDLHPVQREMAVRGGSQCGYCTPGFVCSMAAEYYRADRGVGRQRRLSRGELGPRTRSERLRPPCAERQPVPVHRVPTDPRRRLRARRPGRGRPARPPL